MSERDKGHITCQAEGDRNLLQRMAVGDGEAWASFISQYEDFIYSTVSHCLKPASKEEIEDAVQELFASWADGKHGLYSFEGRNGCSLKSFVAKVATNHALSIRRRRKNLVSLEDQASSVGDKLELAKDHSVSPSIRQVLENQEIREHLENAVNKLAPREGLVFTLYYMDDFSRSEIADFLRMSPNNVDQTLHRIKGKMRDILKDILNAKHKR